MDFELYTLMPHDIEIEPFSHRDAWGNKSYRSANTYRGRIENKRRKVISRTGAEVLSETTIYLATTVGISPDDRLTLPSGYLPQHPEIISVKKDDDEWGGYGTRIYA